MLQASGTNLHSQRFISKEAVAFTAFLLLNLLAAYMPAVFWVPDLPGSGGKEWILVFSPVGLVLLFLDPMGAGVAWCVLIAFLLLVTLISALFYRWRRAWAFVAGVI